MDGLFAYAKKVEPATWEEWLRGLFEGVWLLFQGKILGLSKNDQAWWTLRPYTPSVIHANIKAIHLILNKKSAAPIDADAYARAALEAVK